MRTELQLNKPCFLCRLRRTHGVLACAHQVAPHPLYLRSVGARYTPAGTAPAPGFLTLGTSHIEA